MTYICPPRDPAYCEAYTYKGNACGNLHRDGSIYCHAHRHWDVTTHSEEELSLTLTERCVAYIRGNSGLTATQVAKGLQKHPSSVSSALCRAVKARLLRREFTCPLGGRWHHEYHYVDPLRGV